jgi:hypothetical protein
MNIDKNIITNPKIGLTGMAKNDRKRVRDTCKELLMKKFTT